MKETQLKDDASHKCLALTGHLQHVYADRCVSYSHQTQQ